MADPLIREQEFGRNADFRGRLKVVPRKQFTEEFGKKYMPGQHVTLIGPSGRGKSQLGGEMAISAVHYHPELQIVMLHGKIKGRDETIIRFSKKAHLRIVKTYPANVWTRYQIRRGNLKGIVLRPLDKAGESVEEENKLTREQYAKAIHKSYHANKKRPVILIVDETHQTHEDLKLRRNCEGPLMRGRPVCGVWSFVQRGKFVSYHVYDEAGIVIIFYDPDRDNQERYSQIGDVDPAEIRFYSKQLKTKEVKDGSVISQALVFERAGSRLYIVDF